MKKILFMLVALPMSMVCFSENRVPAVMENHPAVAVLQDNAAVTYKFIALSEAEKVLGEKVHVKDSAWKNSGGIVRYLTTIISYKADKKTGQNKRLFFSYEQFPNENAAKEIYTGLKTENEKTLTVSPFAGTGDEAFWVNDTAGNPFIMIRKSNKIFKLKIYYVTDKNAFERLESLAKRLVADN